MKLIVTIACAVMLVGCASNPGYITKTQSKFDEATELTMTPAWCADGRIRMGLFWSSRMPKGELVLKVGVRGAESISSGESLKVNIDGKKFTFKTFTSQRFDSTPGAAIGTTYIPGNTFTYQTYVVTKDFVTNMIAGQRTIIRLDLNQEYIEDEFSTDAFTMARPAFRDFLAQTDEARKQ